MAKKGAKSRIWIQAVSVGETNAVKKLVESLSNDFEIVLTTTTPTARKIIETQLASKVLFHGYFPWDFWLFSCIAWKRIQPDAIILVESELWPEHLHQAKKHKVPVFLANARLSDRSFKRYKALYRLFPRWVQKFWEQIDDIIASSEESRQRIALFYRKTLECFGNMKFDVATPILSENEKKALKKELGFKENAFVILGCSTWAGEETLLLEVLRILNTEDAKNEKNTQEAAEVSREISKNEHQRYCLLLVPRHAERREEIIDEIKRYGFSYGQRSLGKINTSVQVCLADTTGELGRLAQVADLAFVGKSLPPNEGGQSPLDAACAGIPIIYGNRMTNFRDICTQIEREKAAVKVETREEAIEQLLCLARNPEARETLAKNINRWFHQQQGASEKTYQFIKSHLTREKSISSGEK